MPAARRSSFLLAALTLGALGGHVVYPGTVLAAARRRGPARSDGHQPLADLVYDGPPPAGAFTVVVAAYRESGTIGDCVARWYAAGAAEVLVVVDDDLPTATAAADAGARVLVGTERRGKSDALNRGVAAVSTPVALLTDANTVMAPEHAQRLVNHVLHGAADVAGGVKSESGAEGQDRYWAFENAVKRAEERLGGCPVLVGEAIALRPGQWTTIPQWVKVDDLFIGAVAPRAGRVVRVDTGCVATEPSSPPRAQLERRVRMAAAVLELVTRAPATVLGTDRSSLMLTGHKVWRLSLGPACQMALVLAVLRARFAGPVRYLAAAVLTAPIADYAASSARNHTLTGVRNVAAQGWGMPPVVVSAAVVRLLRRGASLDGTWTKLDR